MILLKKIEHNFWVFLVLAVGLGFVYPTYFSQFEGFVIYILMVIMGFLFLKVDVFDILTHIKKPFFLLYISLFHLLILPVITYFAFYFLDPQTRMAFVLLAALPTGVSSAVFTDIMKAKTSLTLTMVIISNLLAAVTIPFVFFVLYDQSFSLDYSGMFNKLLVLILIPFVIAKIIKRLFFRELVRKLQGSYNMIIILLLSFMIMITVSFQATYLKTNFASLALTLAYLFLAFFIFHIVGYFAAFWHKKGEKIAISNSMMIMNNILGIVIAIAFFNTHVLMIVTLSLIPWNLMIIIKHFYKRYLP